MRPLVAEFLVTCHAPLEANLGFPANPSTLAAADPLASPDEASGNIREKLEAAVAPVGKRSAKSRTPLNR